MNNGGVQEHSSEKAVATERDIFKDFRLMQRILLQNEQNLSVFRRVNNEVNKPTASFDNFDATLGLFINN